MTEVTDPHQVAEAAAAAMWARDRASQAFGMTLEAVGPGTAVVSMAVRADMVNGHDIGHGGMTFTLADSAFAFASNTYDRVSVGAIAEIRFRAPTRVGDVLVAAATERERGERRGIYDVVVTRRGSDEVVANFVGYCTEIGGSVTGG